MQTAAETQGREGWMGEVDGRGGLRGRSRGWMGKRGRARSDGLAWTGSVGSAGVHGQGWKGKHERARLDLPRPKGKVGRRLLEGRKRASHKTKNTQTPNTLCTISSS